MALSLLVASETVNSCENDKVNCVYLFDQKIECGYQLFLGRGLKVIEVNGDYQNRIRLPWLGFALLYVTLKEAVTKKKKVGPVNRIPFRGQQYIMLPETIHFHVTFYVCLLKPP